MKQRTGGSSAGTYDAYYYNPEGKRYRSRADIARDYGISAGKSSGRATATKKTIPTLSREDALAKVRKLAPTLTLPMKASKDVIITSFGTLKPEYVKEDDPLLPMIGYSAECVDTKGIKFISTVVDMGTGAYYSVGAQSTNTEPIEVGSGPSPEDAWRAVEERQVEVNELHKEDGSKPSEEEVEPGDSLLHQAAPLAGQWGRERFGLAHIPCLQALEAQPGVERCTKYKFVEERSNWDEEMRRLMKLKAVDLGLAVEKSGTGSAKKKPRYGTKEEKAAAGVIEKIIRHCELEEQKALNKKNKKLQHELEKKAREMAKAREKEIAKQLQEQKKATEKAAAAEAARRAAEAARTFPDEQLETAALPPPDPSPLCASIDPRHAPVLLEAWHLVRRFRVILGVEDESEIPSVLAMEQALLAKHGTGSGGGPATLPPTTPTSTNKDAVVWTMSTLTNFLIFTLFQKCAERIIDTSSDITDKDLWPNIKTPNPLPMNDDTWQEAARRYLAIVADVAACEGKAGELGLPYPADHFEDWLILQYLLGCPPTQLARGWSALPKGASEHSWLAPLAMHDAAALAAAGPPRGPVTRDPEEADTIVRLQRCILRQIGNVKDSKRGRYAKVLFFKGHSAGAATHMGRSLDLRGVGARVDARVYASEADPMASFIADVNFVLELFLLAATRRSGFAEENRDKGVEEVCGLVASKLQEIENEVKEKGAVAYLNEYAPRRSNGVDGAGGAGDNDNKDGEVKEEEQNQGDQEMTDYADEYELVDESDPVNDLKRPFAPGEGCSVCWDDADDERMMLCSQCNAPYHIYCLDPPLDDVPEGDWLCPGCAPSSVAATATPTCAPPPEFGVGSQGAEIWAMAQLLATKEYAEWSMDERVHLLHMLCMLVEDSPEVHAVLVDEEKTQQTLKKELHAKRNELKQKQQEEAELNNPLPKEGGGGGEGGGKKKGKGKGKKKGEGEGAGGHDAMKEDKEKEGTTPPAGGEAEATAAAPKKSLRSRHELAAEIEALISDIFELDHKQEKFAPQRLPLLGLDRHYNRYWFLPSEALGGDPLGPGAVVIERYLNGVGSSSQTRGGGQQQWLVGLYRDIDAVSTLINWLNPKGHREKKLYEDLKKERTHMQVRVQEMLKNAAPGLGNNNNNNQGKEGEAGEGPKGEGPNGLEAQAMEVDGRSSIDRLRALLLDFESNIPDGARHPLHATPPAMEAWRARVGAASTPSHLMRCLLSLERSINSAWLKPYWRPWSMQAPHPDNVAGTLSAMWLRAEALKSTIKLKVSLKPVSAAVLAKRYPQKRDQAQKEEKKRSAAATGPSTGNNSDEEGKAGRANKRARGPSRDQGGTSSDAVDDEELARRLHAELNAPSHRTSTRLRHSSGVEARDEKRRKSSGHSLRTTRGPKSYKEADDDDLDLGDDDDDETEEDEEEEEEEMEVAAEEKRSNDKDTTPTGKKSGDGGSAGSSGSKKKDGDEYNPSEEEEEEEEEENEDGDE